EATSRLRARTARPLCETYNLVPQSDISSCPEISRTDSPRSGIAQVSQRAGIVNSFVFSAAARVIVIPTKVEESPIVLFSLPGFAAGVVGDSFDHRQFRELALRSQIHSAHYRFSFFAGGRYPGSARLLDFSRRIYLDSSLVRYCACRYRSGARCETVRTD